MSSETSLAVGAAVGDAVVEIYWLPGCSSCLRLKEFAERSGRPYAAINVEEDSAGAAKMKRLGLHVPIACIGDRHAPGKDLKAVAELMGIPYNPPAILSPEELHDRYVVAIEALCRFLAQMPQEALAEKLPNRKRPMLDVADQSATIMRAFLEAYESTSHPDHVWGHLGAPDHIRTPSDLIGRARETLAMFETWWEQDGVEDPLDRVVSTSWGYRTLHEVLERDTWHSAHHIRQIQYILEKHGITPNGRLTPEELAGLPMPERVHD